MRHRVYITSQYTVEELAQVQHAQRKFPHDWATHGRFMSENPEAEVLCGICGAEYHKATMKAEHLAAVHGAWVEHHVHPSGHGEYHWMLPGKVAR